MKNLAACVFLLSFCASSAQAKLIPHYGMDSLVRMSDIVVYCDPGPLELSKQEQPENFALSNNEVCGEQEFLKDMAIALKKSATLKEPVPPFSNGAGSQKVQAKVNE